jgi:hypothetical protein
MSPLDKGATPGHSPKNQIDDVPTSDLSAIAHAPQFTRSNRRFSSVEGDMPMTSSRSLLDIAGVPCLLWVIERRICTISLQHAWGTWGISLYAIVSGVLIGMLPAYKTPVTLSCNKNLQGRFEICVVHVSCGIQAVELRGMSF